MNGEGEPPQFLISLLMVKRMVVIDVDQGFLSMSLSRMMKTTIISTETGAHLPRRA